MATGSRRAQAAWMVSWCTAGPCPSRRTLLALAGALVLALSAGGCGDAGATTEEPPESSAGAPRVETVAEGLEAPWELAFLPDGRALITERPGRVRVLSADGRLQQAPLAEIPVSATGEGGLLGLAIDPQFGDNGFVYLYRTTAGGNEIVRYRMSDDGLDREQVLVDGIPASSVHDGGRLRTVVEGPAGGLYVLTSNRDGRGSPDDGDDRILRVTPPDG
jgi:glucose/arabinose dehydrogenase